MRKVMVYLCGLLTACAMEAPPPPSVPPPVETVVFLPSVREQAPDCIELPSLAWVGPTYPCPKPRKHVEVETMRTPSGEVLLTNLPRKAPRDIIETEPLPKKRAKALSPMQIVRDAEKAALVFPQQRGYPTGTAYQHYQWQPLSLYVVYVGMDSATYIHLPPGEVLMNALSLDGEEWFYGTTHIQTETQSQDVIQIVAKQERKVEAKVSLLTSSGRPYNLHLIGGKTGMFGVRFVLAPIQQIQVEEESTPIGERR